jgi:hypothetical protein
VSDKTKARSQTQGEDVALVWGKTKNGGMNVLRKRADRIEAGVVEPLREGTPIHGEVVQLHKREDSPLYDVEVHVPRPKTDVAVTETRGAGPAQVATDEYRKNWDSIYRRSARKLLN